MVLKERPLKNLRELRKKARHSQEMAAELCGLRPRFWGKLEQGRASAAVDTLEKISVGLNVQGEELFKERTEDEREPGTSPGKQHA